MKLFKIENEMPILNPEARMLEPFKILITRDKGSKGDVDGRKKIKAMKELAYVHFKYHPSSQFIDMYRGVKLEEELKRAIGLEEEWNEDKEVKAAGLFYKNLNSSITVKTVETARGTLFLATDMMVKYQDMLNDAMQKEVEVVTAEDIKVEEERLKFFMDSITKLITITTNIPKSIEALETAKKKVTKEVESISQNKREVDATETPEFYGS